MTDFSKDKIFTELKDILVKEFELPEDKITLDAGLFDDLDLDSIDAVDIAVRLQRFVNKKISPEGFKQIRTVSDVVNAVYELLNE
ncbi:MAG: acyl carrier protein [Candidatus Gastranaerophilaceae bacterium]